MVSTAVKTCINDGCSEPRSEGHTRCLQHFRQHHREVCAAYRERRRASKPRRIPRSERTCRVCGDSVWAKDLCRRHYKTDAVRPPCSIPGCSRSNHAQGLCCRHYDAARKRGELKITQPQGVLTPQQRFRQYVEITDACHLWTGFQSGGRGHFFVGDGAVTQAHRASFEFERGPIPTDEQGNTLDLDHGCRVPLCVNPQHLEPVTTVENARRQSVAAGRASFTQRDGWLLFVAIPEWTKGANNFPANVVTTHAQAAS